MYVFEFVCECVCMCLCVRAFIVSLSVYVYESMSLNRIEIPKIAPNWVISILKGYYTGDIGGISLKEESHKGSIGPRKVWDSLNGHKQKKKQSPHNFFFDKKGEKG